MRRTATGEGQRLIGALLDAQRSGLNPGVGGDGSFRPEPDLDRFVITPAGAAYDQLAPADLVAIEADGIRSSGPQPSADWPFHWRIYQHRPDISAVIHFHSPAATALATLGRSIPAFHFMVAAAGGNSIRCSQYATFGTDELADAVIVALEDRRACLIANHGMVACGDSVQSAYRLAIEVETLAQQYALALAVGNPVILDDREMDEVLKRLDINDLS